jgi:hypothetical protein
MHRASVLFIVCLLPSPAFPAGEGEMALTAGPGLALALAGSTRVGASVDARFLYGLSDAWSLRFGLAGSWIASSDADGATRVVAPALGTTVAADVLNWVPFGEAGIVVGDARGGGGAARQYLGGQLGAGVEHLVTRRLTVTLLGRVSYFALRLAGPDVTKPVELTIALHLGRVFGP